MKYYNTHMSKRLQQNATMIPLLTENTGMLLAASYDSLGQPCKLIGRRSDVPFEGATFPAAELLNMGIRQLCKRSRSCCSYPEAMGVVAVLAELELMQYTFELIGEHSPCPTFAFFGDEQRTWLGTSLFQVGENSLYWADCAISGTYVHLDSLFKWVGL